MQVVSTYPYYIIGWCLKSFSDLQTEFALPRSQFCEYLQLRHAVQAQDRITKFTPVDHPLMPGVLLEKDKKGMISKGYSILLQSTQDVSKLPYRKGKKIWGL